MTLYELSIVKFNQSIKYIKLIQDEKIKNDYLYFVYSWKLGNFEEMKKIDSMYSMQKKCMSLTPHPLLYVTVAERYLKQNKHSDSVGYYLNKALKISDKFPLYQKGIIFLNYGKLYKLKKDNLKALDYYFQSLGILKDIHRKKEEKDLYKLIAQCYKSLNNKEKAGEYLEKYSILSDSLNGNERKIVTIPIEKLLQEKQAQKKLLKYLFYATIFGIILLAFLTIHFVHKKYLKKQEKKDKIL
jgi:tetratricopeptide (TPR) repeat protein